MPAFVVAKDASLAPKRRCPPGTSGDNGSQLPRIEGRALAQLDLAQAHLYAGDIDESCTVAVEALSIPPETLVAPILRRAQELRAEMESTADSVVIRAFNEQVRYLSESRGTTPASDASRD